METCRAWCWAVLRTIAAESICWSPQPCPSFPLSLATRKQLRSATNTTEQRVEHDGCNWAVSTAPCCYSLAAAITSLWISNACPFKHPAIRIHWLIGLSASHKGRSFAVLCSISNTVNREMQLTSMPKNYDIGKWNLTLDPTESGLRI